MPPEALLASPRYSEKIDTFSLGVLIIQIVTRKFPAPTNSQVTVNDPRSPTEEIIIPVSELERRKSDIEEIPPKHSLLPIVRECLKDRHQQRPEAAEICQVLDSIKTMLEYQESSSEMPDLIKSLSQQSLVAQLNSPISKKPRSQSIKEDEGEEILKEEEVKEKDKGRVDKLDELEKAALLEKRTKTQKESKHVFEEIAQKNHHEKKLPKNNKVHDKEEEVLDKERGDQEKNKEQNYQREKEKQSVKRKHKQNDQEDVPVGKTDLHVAAVLGDIEAVKRLLTTSISINSRTEDKGYTALLLASLKGHVEVVKALIKANAKIDLQDENGFSPLCAASHGGHTEVVELLVRAGADIHLATTKSGSVPVEVAADSGHAKTVHRLLEFGADPNHQNINGQTPLFAAALKGHSDVVRILVLDKKAGINICSNIGCSPVYVASQGGHTEVVELLVHGGADIHLPTNEYGSVPLMTAAFNGHAETVKKLLELGGNPNYRNKFGCTALDMARQNNQSQVEEILNHVTQ